MYLFKIYELQNFFNIRHCKILLTKMFKSWHWPRSQVWLSVHIYITAYTWSEWEVTRWCPHKQGLNRVCRKVPWEVAVPEKWGAREVGCPSLWGGSVARFYSTSFTSVNCYTQKYFYMNTRHYIATFKTIHFYISSEIVILKLKLLICLFVI